MTVTRYKFANNQEADCPTAEEIEALRVGDIILTCFGREGRVVEVRARGVNVEGRPYVMGIVSWGDHDGRMSFSLVADTIESFVSLEYTSAHIRASERAERLRRRVQL